MPTVQVPVEMVEGLAALRFPPTTDTRLQRLMERNTAGQLTEAERMELEALVEFREQLAPLRAQALQVLGRNLA
jgi:hypothetical protein